jgi:dynactin 1
MGSLLQDLKTIGESLRQLAKRIRRHLPDPPKQPPVSNKLQSQLLNDSVTLRKVVKILQEACKQAVRNHGMISGNEGIPGKKVEEYLYSAMENCDSRVEGSGGVKEVLKEWLTTSLMTMTDLAQVVSEAPVFPKEKPATPLYLRSQAVKAELDQTRNLKIQLEDKESTIKELKKILGAKKDELSEALIRKELAEKKASNATKDSEMTIEKLNRKLEDVQSMLQRKEREFEAALAHFQSDIESLESEKGELKAKLMNSAKQKFIEGISRSSAGTPLQSPAHELYNTSMSGSQLSPVGFNTTSHSGLPSSTLIEYTRFLQRQNWRLRSAQVAANMKKLKPLDLPKKEDRDAVKELEKEYWKLKREWNHLLCDSLRIALRNDILPPRKQYLVLVNNTRKAELAERITELKQRMMSTMSERGIGRIIKADFACFSTERSKQEKEAEAIKVATIRFPGWEKSSDQPRRLLLTPEQVQKIHKLLEPI